MVRQLLNSGQFAKLKKRTASLFGSPNKPQSFSGGPASRADCRLAISRAL
ncbi:hypothetical protein YSY43_02920 [Paenibacillus sp. YSY-4.3]